MTVTAIAEPDNTWALFTAASEGKKLPPYYLLCKKVQEELRSTIRIVYSLRPMATPASYLLAFSGVGHVFTAAGRSYLTIVRWKYFLFVCVCVGIWTDEIYQAYRIEAEVRQFTIRDQDDATIEFLMLAIASRVILLQALGPTATLISIVVVSTCDAPLLVFSSQLRALIPPLLHLHPRERAELRRHCHSEENIRLEEWAVATHSLSILLTESRLVVFLYNLVSLTLTLTLLILMGIELSTEIAVLLLTAMLPYYVGSTFTPILYIGKRLNLKDEDFCAVFPCWMSLSTLLPCEICRWAGAAAAGVWETAVCGSIRRRLVRRSAAVHSLIVGNQEDGEVVETGLYDAGGWVPERGGGGDGSRPRQQGDHRHTAEEGKNSNPRPTTKGRADLPWWC